MKKRFLALLSLFMIPSFLAISSMKSASFDAAYASYDTKKVFEDNFDEDEIDTENWSVTGDVTFKQHYSSMRINPKNYVWGSAVTLNREFSGNYKVKIELATHELRGWFGISFGSPTIGSQFSSSKGGLVFFDNNISEVLDIPAGSLTALGEYHLSAFGNETNAKRRIEMNIVKIDNNHSSLQCEIFENNTSLGNVFSESYLYDNSLDGYMSFNSNLKEVEIYSVEVLDDADNRLYYDNFSTSSVLYPSSGSIDAEWQSTVFDEEELKVGYVNSLFLGSVNSNAIYNSKLDYVDNKDLSIAYKIETEIQYLAMDFGVVSGIEIGKESKNENGYFFGLKREVIGYSLVYSFNGNKTELQCLTENSNMTALLSLTIYQNGEVLYKCGDLDLAIDDLKYAGYVALFAQNEDENTTNGTGGSFNYFRITKDNYYKRDNPDLYMNFNGVKTTYYEEIDEYGSDYFISKKEWSMGSNVQLSKWRSKDKGNGKLEFNGANGSSFFSPKKVYKDYIVKFDVEITSTIIPNGGTIGLEFGNSQLGAYYENTKSLGIGYYKVEGEYATVPSLKNVDYAPGADTIFTDDLGNPINIFKDNGKFTLVYVVRNKTVSLYFLLENEEKNGLGKVKTSAICSENQTTDGYFAIFGINEISFTVDNLSIINLDLDVPATEYSGKSDYQEVTRLDFSNSSSLDGLNSNNAEYLLNKYRINNNGEIKTSKTTNDFIFRSKVKDIENTLLVEQDSIKIKFVNSEEKYIEIDDGASVQKEYLNSRFAFKNSMLEIEKINTTLRIRFIDGNASLSEFEDSVISFNIASSGSGILSIKAVNGFVDLGSFTFLNLNKYATITARNYDKKIDDFDPWVVRDTESDASSNTKKTGCSGSFTYQSLIVLSISIIGLIVLSIYKRRTQK